MRALFSIVKGKDKGKSFYVTEGKPLTLGRSSAADIALSEPRISRSLCRFTHDGKHIMLTDLNSTNGTYVNERKIKSVPLTDQDAIRIGETVITMTIEAGAEQPEAKAPEKEPERPKRAAAEAPEPAPRKRPAARDEEGASAGEAARTPERPPSRKAADTEGGVMGLFDKWLDEPQKGPEKRAPEPPKRAPSQEEGAGRARPERPTATPPPPPSAGPAAIPGIELKEKVGDDALGELYKGLHTFLERPVSVRILAGAAAQNRRNTDDFIETARANARLTHPNVLQIYDAGKWKGGYYAVSAVPEGMTLEALMAREGPKRPLPVTLALELTFQLARALRRVHAEKLVHWDLRPGTIFISRERVAKIGGFSFPATLVRSARAAGEMTSSLPVNPYMPPELIHDLDMADARADVYGLSAVLYEMAAGRPPFRAESERDLTEMILRDRPETPQKRNASLSSELCLLILKGLAKDPANRQASVADLIKELKALPKPKASGEEQ